MTNNRRQMTDWLPTTKKEMNLRGWEEADIILFSGDAYIDHPSFGTAVIGRLLEKEGLKVAVVPQPNWRDDLRDFRKFGKPNLFFAVTAGVMDSMINHYTANKRLRSNDAYTPDGRSDMRPDRAVTVYSKILKDLYPDVPIVLGGIEASLRRVTHYDYWDDSLHKTILAETGADFLIYGMGELPLKQLIKNIREGRKISEIYDLPQSAFLINKKSIPENPFKEEVALFSHEECLKDKLKQAKNFRVVEEQSNRISAARILQAVDDKVLIVNPPYPPMKEEEIDASFDLPYTRLPHPKYKGKHIPAYEMIKFSVNMHRGCFGGCAFCTISAHQGKFIASRTKESILNEVKIGENSEILVRGGTVMSGYYNKPEATKEVFTEDGFFRTGDAGMLTDDGEIILTERIKDLYKTSNGKYIAPQMIETRISEDKYIDQVAVIGDERKFVSALIIPNYLALKAYADSQGIPYESTDDLVKNDVIHDYVFGRIELLQSQFTNYEKIKKITLLPQPFSIESGELTNTLKLRRKVILERYADIIDQMYID
jgi:hypothetical protein